MLLSWALICLMLSAKGFSQTPPAAAQCVRTHTISNEDDIYIMPGVVTCFSCNLPGTITWQIEENRESVPLSQSSNAEAVGNFLVIASPDTYVTPGTAGRRDILCTSLTDGQNYEVRLASPILAQPLFLNATVNEGELLEITCLIRNIPDISTFEVLDPNGRPVNTILGVFTVESVNRTHAGTYTCIVRSTLDNSTVSATSAVVVQYAPQVTITAFNSSSPRLRIMLGEELHLECNYTGVPAPNIQWSHDGVLLKNGVDNASIFINTGVNFSRIVIVEVDHSDGGTYTCRANNSLGTDQESYSVILEYDDLTTTSTTTIVTAASTTTTVSAPGLGNCCDNGFTPQVITGVTLASVFVLVGVLLILGFLVYTIAIRTKMKTNRCPTVEVKLSAIDEQVEGASDQVSNETEHQDSRTERSDNTLIYADIGPNTVNRLKKVAAVPDDSKYRVQYAEINYKAKAPQNLCVPPTPEVNEALLNSVVDLDSLLMLLKEELAPKWYDFGLVVGVPQELMDSYSGYPPDQCLTEVLDYWLRQHPGEMKWTEVADALKAVQLNQLAEKAQKLSAQKFSGGGDVVDVDNRASEKVDVAENDGCTAEVEVNVPKLPPKPQPQVG